jgi:hypothetical protein
MFLNDLFIFFDRQALDAPVDCRCFWDHGLDDVDQCPGCPGRFAVLIKPHAGTPYNQPSFILAVIKLGIDDVVLILFGFVIENIQIIFFNFFIVELIVFFLIKLQ